MRFRNSYRFKLIFCLLAVSIMTILLFSAFIFSNMQKSYNNQIEEYSNTSVQRITSSISKNITDAGDVLDSLILSTYDGASCIDKISKEEVSDQRVSPSKRLYNYRMFKYVCGNLLENADHVESAYLFCKNGQVYSYTINTNYGLEKDYQDSSWYQQLTEPDNTPSIITMIETSQTVRNKGKPSLFIAKKYRTVSGQMAIVGLVCDESVFDEISEKDNKYWISCQVIDGDGNSVFGDLGDTTLTEKQVANITNNKEGILWTDHSQQAYVYEKVGVNDWSVVALLSYMQSHELYQRNLLILIAMILLDCILIFVVVIHLDRKHINPIVQLSGIMKKVPYTGLTFRNPYVGRKDEVGVLYDYYDKMIQQINLLIEEKYEGEIKVLQSRLRYLTSQINAHFIFNTLENISCLAQIEGNKQIGKMSKSLGDMLRYSMDIDSDFVRLSQEIEHIRRYIDIQEIRFGNKIELCVEMQDHALERRVMKFMLQPIVENAIEHGLSQSEAPWVIYVTARRSDACMEIQVRDNGEGMNKAHLETVRQNIVEHYRDEEQENNSIGLANIDQRIKLLFSEEYGLTVDSNLQRGTIVTVKIPWM